MFDLTTYLTAHNAWSARTFGVDRKPPSIIAHLRNELEEELKKEPDDLLEWADIMILAADGAFVCGFPIDSVVSEMLNHLGSCFVNDRDLFAIVTRLEEAIGEAEDDPFTLFSWIWIAILAIRGARCAGFSFSQILVALQHKQSINFGRRWPAPGDPNEPTEHVREKKQ